MRLGISTFALAWSIGVPGREPANPLALPDILDLAKRWGYAGVQIADNARPEQLGPESTAELSASARQRGLFLELGGRGLTEKNLLRHLELAAGLSSPLLRMVIDAAGYEPPADTIEGLLRESASECEARNIKLGIENHDRFEARQFARWLDRIDSEWLGVCLDSVNSFGCGEGLKETLDTLIPYTINFHLKDFSISRLSHSMGFAIEGTPAGEGMLPIAACIERLEHAGRCESAIVELWPPPEEDIDQTVRKEKAWCEQSRRNLAKLFPLT